MKIIAVILLAGVVAVGAQTNAPMTNAPPRVAQTVTVRVDAIGTQIGSVSQCLVTVSNKSYTMQLERLPPRIAAHFAEQNRLLAQIKTLEGWVTGEAARLDRLEDVMPSEAPYDSPAGAAIRQLNYDAKVLGRKRDELASLKASLADLVFKTDSVTKVEVRQTSRVYSGQFVWECRD